MFNRRRVKSLNSTESAAATVLAGEHHRRIGLLGWIAVSLATVFLAFVIRAFVFQTFKIPSSSMYPTLQVGDHIIVSKLSYGFFFPGFSGLLFEFSEPAVGDVVVFYRFSEFEDIDASLHYSKRIVAGPGDTVEVKGGVTSVNGTVLEEKRPPKISISDELGLQEGRNYGPVKLGPGSYFVVGDNRSNSKDSRFYGPISKKDIEGRAVLIYWSWGVDEGGSWRVAWDRIGKRIR